MKIYRQEYFNRNSIVGLLTELSHTGSQLYLAVDVMESMRVTSLDEAVKDKIAVYDRYANHTLKYAEIARIHETENIVRGFLLKHCAMAEAILKDDPAIPLRDLIDQCSMRYPEIVTAAKCVLAFLYVAAVMKRVEVPSFMMNFSPYSLVRCRGVDVLPVSSDENKYCLYFQLDLQKPAEIIGTVMGAYCVHLCLTDLNHELQYYIRMTDEECAVADYTDNDNTIRLLNDICKGDSKSFKPCPPIT